MGSIIGGLIALALGIFALISWQWRVVEFFQGLIPLALIIGGIVAVVAGLDLAKEEGLLSKKKSKTEIEEEE